MGIGRTSGLNTLALTFGAGGKTPDATSSLETPDQQLNGLVFGRAFDPLKLYEDQVEFIIGKSQQESHICFPGSGTLANASSSINIDRESQTVTVKDLQMGHTKVNIDGQVIRLTRDEEKVLPFDRDWTISWEDSIGTRIQNLPKVNQIRLIRDTKGGKGEVVIYEHKKPEESKS